MQCDSFLVSAYTRLHATALYNNKKVSQQLIDKETEERIRGEYQYSIALSQQASLPLFTLQVCVGVWRCELLGFALLFASFPALAIYWLGDFIHTQSCMDQLEFEAEIWVRAGATKASLTMLTCLRMLEGCAIIGGSSLQLFREAQDALKRYRVMSLANAGAPQLAPPPHGFKIPQAVLHGMRLRSNVFALCPPACVRFCVCTACVCKQIMHSCQGYTYTCACTSANMHAHERIRGTAQT